MVKQVRLSIDSVPGGEITETTNQMQLIQEALIERDRKQETLVPIFAAFREAAHRIAVHKESNEGEANNELIERLRESRNELKTRLEMTQEQLEEMYKKNRDLNEERYLKASNVQNLYDEILALNMQLNLSEEKRKRLQDELGR